MAVPVSLVWEYGRLEVKGARVAGLVLPVAAPVLSMLIISRQVPTAPFRPTRSRCKTR